LVDGGTHPHGYRSNFEYRFTEDWIRVRWKPGGRIAFDWTQLRRRRGHRGQPHPEYPELLFAIDGEGERVESFDSRRHKGDVRAIFDRPNGRRCGAAMFHPQGATYEHGLPWHDGSQAMAFTFCTEDEFPGLLAKWREQEAPPPEPTWQQGERRD
jgi:hypothetical protein